MMMKHTHKRCAHSHTHAHPLSETQSRRNLHQAHRTTARSRSPVRCASAPARPHERVKWLRETEDGGRVPCAFRT
jgi:hypothetical protein